MTEPLTPTEKRRILAGDHNALRRRVRPQVAVGDVLVVRYSKESRHVSDRSTGALSITPEHPEVWIEVSHPPFLKEGIWYVRFHVVDKRQSPRFMQRGADYGTSAQRSIDKDDGNAIEAVDDKGLKHFAKNRELFLEAKLEEEQRRQERVMRERSKRAARELSGTAWVQFAAGWARLLEEAYEQDEAA